MDGLTGNLIQWLKTFDLDIPGDSVEELSDGSVIAQALNKISPEFFGEEWLSKIKTDTGSNWRLRVSNLKKIQKAVTDYYSEVLEQPIIGFRMPDVTAIGERSDPVELGRLLQLVLGCAVNCDRKQEYIEAIMRLEEVVQHVVKNAIEEVMAPQVSEDIPSTYPSDVYSGLHEQLKGLTDDLASAKKSKEQITQRCHELDMQVAMLVEEKSNLLAENEKLLKRLNQVESFEGPSTLTGKRFQQQQKLDMLQDELYKLEIVRDELKAKGENQQKEILELQQKNEDFSKMAEEYQSMKDELDFHRHISEKVSMYEASIETYKKKLEDLSDLKRQVKVLEDKCTHHMQRGMELEEELKKTSLIKSQMEMYKDKSQELQTKFSDETKRAERSEFENKRIQEKLTSLQKEKERLITERDSLRESLEEMRCMQQQDASSQEGHGTGGSIGDSDLLDAVPPEIREKLIRLQHENKILKLNESTSVDKQLTLLQSMLDDAKLRENELETDNRLANRRIMELESHLEDIEANQAVVNVQEDVELRQKLSFALKKQKDSEADIQKKRVVIESLESQVEASVHKSHELQEMLNKKDEEMKEMEERYRRYLKKAKNVIKTLNPAKHTGPGVDLSALRSVLLEKEKQISNLEKEIEKMKMLQDMEDKLITTAFYNLGIHLQKRMAFERLNQGDLGNTFLSRQRQITSRRLTTPNASPSDFYEY